MAFDPRFTALAILTTYGLVATLERASALRYRESRFLRPYFLTDVGWYVSAVLITLTFGPVLERVASGVEALGIPTLARAGLPLWVLVPIGIVLYDFGAFVCHVVLHRVEWLWRLHKVHHSSRVLDWLATTRAHTAEHLFRTLPTHVLLFAVGLPAEAVALSLVVYAGFATFGHSNLRLPLGFLERLFVTPRLHRLHHVPSTTNKNFGTVFTFWDRLAGCLVERDADVREGLGVPGEAETYPQLWWRQFREPFRVSSRIPSGVAARSSQS